MKGLIPNKRLRKVHVSIWTKQLSKAGQQTKQHVVANKYSYKGKYTEQQKNTAALIIALSSRRSFAKPIQWLPCNKDVTLIDLTEISQHFP